MCKPKDFIVVIILFLIVCIYYGCDKNDETNFKEDKKEISVTFSLKNVTITDITANFVNSIDIIDNDIYYNTINVGVVSSLNPNPTIVLNDTFTVDKLSIDSFTSNLENLTPSTRYFIKPYTKILDSIYYGEEIEIITQDEYSYELRYISGNGQCFAGGGLPEPMMFLIQDKKTRTQISDLKTRKLLIESNTTLGKMDGDFVLGVVDYCWNCFVGYTFLDEVSDVDTSISTFWVTVNLIKDDLKIDSIRFHHFITDVPGFPHPNE